jgi:hypothetical protein
MYTCDKLKNDNGNPSCLPALHSRCTIIFAAEKNKYPMMEGLHNMCASGEFWY